MAAMLYGSLSILIPDWEPILKSDVFRAHEAGGKAMIAGENPYSDAVVFESGDPNKPAGTLVIGYPYPPPPLLTYGLLAGVSDPRVVSLLAWLIVGFGLAWLSLARHGLSSFALGSLVILATTPIWRTTMFLSWTEPISVALIGASFWAIGRWKRWGWVLLGVALASKQYLIFLAPLALIYRDDSNKRPGWISLASAAVVAGFPVLFGPREYFQAIVGVAQDIGFRPDSQSLNGMIHELGGDFLIPTGLGILAVVGVLTTLRVLRLGYPLLPGGGVVVLATLFLTTSAFPNYWLLVAALAAFSAVVAAGDEYRGGEASELLGGDVQVET
jgi:hypothetical protein